MPLTRVAVMTLLALASGACGVRAQDTPQRLGESAGVELPDPVASSVDLASAPVEVFFVHDDRLVAVVRPVEPVGVGAAVRVLLEGPTEAEAEAGLRSAVPVGTRLRRATLTGTTATVDLSASFADVSGENQVPAVAQLVFTATSVPGVERVAIAVEGEIIEVPRSDGTLTPGPLSRADFPGLPPT